MEYFKNDNEDEENYLIEEDDIIMDDSDENKGKIKKSLRPRIEKEVIPKSDVNT